MKTILSAISLAALLCGCATTPQNQQLTLQQAQSLTIFVTDAATTGAILAGDAKGVDLRPAFSKASLGLNLLSQTTNAISLADIQAQLAMFNVTNFPVALPILSDQFNNLNQVIVSFNPQIQNMTTNQAAVFIRGIAGAQALGISNALLVTARH